MAAVGAASGIPTVADDAGPPCWGWAEPVCCCWQSEPPRTKQLSTCLAAAAGASLGRKVLYIHLLRVVLLLLEAMAVNVLSWRDTRACQEHVVAGGQSGR